MTAWGQNEKVSQRAFLDRCTPESGHCSARLARQKSAKSGREQAQHGSAYSITSSARARKDSGIASARLDPVAHEAASLRKLAAPIQRRELYLEGYPDRVLEGNTVTVEVPNDERDNIIEEAESRNGRVEGE